METLYTIRLAIGLGITLYAVWWIHRNGGIGRFLRLVRRNMAAEREQRVAQRPPHIWRTAVMAGALAAPFIAFGAFIVSASGELVGATIPAVLALAVIVSVFRNRRSKARAPQRSVQVENVSSRTELPKKAETTETTRTRVKNLVIFKSGERPGNEMWYIQEVCRSINLQMTELEGGHINVRCVDSSNLNQAYVMGYALQSGFDSARCTLTPFADRDGGRGLVLKVKA